MRKGPKPPEHDKDDWSSALLADYCQRKRLAELGYKFDGSKLSDQKAECFRIISEEIAKVESEELEKINKRRR